MGVLAITNIPIDGIHFGDIHFKAGTLRIGGLLTKEELLKRLAMFHDESQRLVMTDTTERLTSDEVQDLLKLAGATEKSPNAPKWLKTRISDINKARAIGSIDLCSKKMDAEDTKNYKAVLLSSKY